jgi:hypothetical protein
MPSGQFVIHNVAKQVDGVKDPVVAESVDHAISVPGGVDQPTVAHDSEVLRDIGLAHPKKLAQLANRLRLVAHGVEDHQSLRVIEGAAEAGRQLFEFHPYVFIEHLAGHGRSSRRSFMHHITICAYAHTMEQWKLLEV